MLLPTHQTGVNRSDDGSQAVGPGVLVTPGPPAGPPSQGSADAAVQQTLRSGYAGAEQCPIGPANTSARPGQPMQGHDHGDGDAASCHWSCGASASCWRSCTTGSRSSSSSWPAAAAAGCARRHRHRGGPGHHPRDRGAARRRRRRARPRPGMAANPSPAASWPRPPASRGPRSSPSTARPSWPSSHDDHRPRRLQQRPDLRRLPLGARDAARPSASPPRATPPTAPRPPSAASAQPASSTGGSVSDDRHLLLPQHRALSALRYQPGRDGRREQQHRERHHRGLRAPPRRGSVRRRPDPAGHVVPLRRRRRRCVGSGRRPGWPTRFLDSRSRREHGTQSYLDTRVGVLDRVESGIGGARRRRRRCGARRLPQRLAGPGQPPRAPPLPAARCSPAAQALADAVRAQAATSTDESRPARPRSSTSSPRSTRRPADLAARQRQHRRGSRGSGSTTTTSLDQRDLLALRARRAHRGRGRGSARTAALDVTVGGVALVAGATASTLTVATAASHPTAPPTAPPSPSRWPGPSRFHRTEPCSGGWRARRGQPSCSPPPCPAIWPAWTRWRRRSPTRSTRCTPTGYDQNGDPGSPSSPTTRRGRPVPVPWQSPTRPGWPPPASPAASWTAAVAEALGDLDVADSAYQQPRQRVRHPGAVEQAAGSATQQVLTTQVDGSREQLVGRQLRRGDREHAAAQRAYEAAARVMSTLDSVLDTLINRTGVNADGDPARDPEDVGASAR